MELGSASPIQLCSASLFPFIKVEGISNFVFSFNQPNLTEHIRTQTSCQRSSPTRSFPHQTTGTTRRDCIRTTVYAVNSFSSLVKKQTHTNTSMTGLRLYYIFFFFLAQAMNQTWLTPIDFLFFHSRYCAGPATTETDRQRHHPLERQPHVQTARHPGRSQAGQEVSDSSCCWACSRKTSGIRSRRTIGYDPGEL